MRINVGSGSPAQNGNTLIASYRAWLGDVTPIDGLGHLLGAQDDSLCNVSRRAAGAAYHPSPNRVDGESWRSPSAG